MTAPPLHKTPEVFGSRGRFGEFFGVGMDWGYMLLQQMKCYVCNKILDTRWFFVPMFGMCKVTLWKVVGDLQLRD